eukprot:2052521-Rhodomonas_salina.2
MIAHSASAHSSSFEQPQTTLRLPAPGPTPRNPVQGTAISGQSVPGMRFAVFDFGGGCYGEATSGPQASSLSSDLRTDAAAGGGLAPRLLAVAAVTPSTRHNGQCFSASNRIISRHRYTFYPRRNGQCFSNQIASYYHGIRQA